MKLLNLILMISVCLSLTACGSDDESQPPDSTTNLAVEYIELEFTGGTFAETVITGTKGVSVTETLRAIKNYNSNTVMGVNENNEGIVTMKIEHEGATEPGEYTLGSESDYFAAEGNKMVISDYESKGTPDMTSVSGTLKIVTYDDEYYEGTFTGIFAEEDGTEHEVKGKFKIER